MPNLLFFERHGPFTIKQLAEIAECEVIGDNQMLIYDVATLSSADVGNITFLSNSKYLPQLPITKASACIMEQRHVDNTPKGMIMLISDNPYASYAKVAATFYPNDKPKASISDKAVISSKAKLGANCQVEPFAHIADDVEIGDDCYIGSGTYIAPGVKIGSGTYIAANVTISHAIIGKNCLIHPGARIGQRGFGWAPSKRGVLEVPQLGSVVIGNNVEVGANSCIDRGTLEDTTIGDSTKIDNLVQLGHGVVVGSHCFLAGQVGIAGSTVVGNGVMFGGQVGVAGHLKIGNGVMLLAQSGAMRDIPDKMVAAGTPSVERMQWHRQNVALAKLAAKRGEGSSEPDTKNN
ncbi:MAG: UDP-3-O-(3-hydroxymyristoyl)glucosamine N-acyltransferase [Proteobacteria bacterium]|nr:UDP-3-O-(3-hydroxymyristoyl)glucosamine N-acyltransferase [Pseudomonadota bacterium]